MAVFSGEDCGAVQGGHPNQDILDRTVLVPGISLEDSVQIHDQTEFGTVLFPGQQFETVADFERGQPSYTFFPQRNPFKTRCSNRPVDTFDRCSDLQPAIADRIQRHPATVIPDGDGRVVVQIQFDRNILRIGVVRVLDQFVHSQSRATDQFVAQQPEDMQICLEGRDFLPYVLPVAF